MTVPASPAQEHPDAPSGKARKYARVELERRFLLREPPPGEVVRRVRIEDRYLAGTRLRLRRATDLATGTVERKLTQKIPAPGGGPGLITTIYLADAEYEVLRSAAAATLSKVRASVPPFGVDTFDGALAGLVLAEVEFEHLEAQAAFVAPSWLGLEVTLDPRFTGGQLASTSAADLRRILVDLDEV